MLADAEQRAVMGLSDEVRDRILSDPALLLEDAEVMQALVAANDRAMGENIVDLRGIAMRKLEGRLDRLEETHRSVIAAAYENLAGTNMVHRAVLQLMEPLGFEAFLAALEQQVMPTLRVDAIRLVLETRQGEGEAMADFGPVVRIVEAGFCETYLGLGAAQAWDPGQGRGSGPAQSRGPAARKVVLRASLPESERVFGPTAARIRSEAVLRLDLGAGRLPGLLVMGAEDGQQFRATQGIDLLTFFARSFELSMRHWLS